MSSLKWGLKRHAIPPFSNINIFDFIKYIDIKVLVEIGCNIGEDTEKFRKLHPNARIVCFEPDPRNIKVLNDKNLNDIAEVYPYAVSNVNSKMTFYQSSGDVKSRDPTNIFADKDWSLSSSLKKPTGHLEAHTWITFNNTVEVDCVRLDDFDPLKNTIIDFMWVDVQGAEDLVYSGAKETLSRTRYLYTEYSNTELYENQLNLEKILKLLGDNWEVLHLFPNDVLLKNKNIKRT